MQVTKKEAQKEIVEDILNKEINFEAGEVVKEEAKKVIDFYYGKTDLSEKILKIQPLHYDESKLWWAWETGNYKWKLIDETDVLCFVEKLSGANTIKSNEKNEILESLKQTSRKKKPEDIKKTWVQFKDVIVDIETGKEIKASPKYFVTNPIPWSLHDERFTNTPNMDKIFEDWVGKDYVQTLYEIISYCLIPNYPINRLFCFIGNGMNGKSKFLELLRKFIGKENVCATELDTLITSRFEVTRLHRKLVCMMGETNFNEMSKTSIIKKLTGQDVIGFEYKNKNPFEEVNYAKILIATNNLPTTTDKTIGFYRRWLIIDFPNQFSEKKDILNDIPEEEYKCLAVKCLGVLKGLLDKREFHKEGSVEQRMKKYEEKSDFFKKFLDEFVEEDLEQHITKADFYKKFVNWCKENRHRQLGENTVGRKMKECGIETGKKSFDWLNDGRGGRLRVWLGVKWKE